jgi:hypothetical protein
MIMATFTHFFNHYYSAGIQPHLQDITVNGSIFLRLSEPSNTSGIIYSKKKHRNRESTKRTHWKKVAEDLIARAKPKPRLFAARSAWKPLLDHFISSI